jgi:hypothetical protein
VLDGLADAMFQVIGWAVKLTPLAVVSYVAYSTAHYGWSLVAKLALFVAIFYMAAQSWSSWWCSPSSPRSSGFPTCQWCARSAISFCSPLSRAAPRWYSPR